MRPCSARSRRSRTTPPRSRDPDVFVLAGGLPDSTEPFLLRVAVELTANAYPKIAFGPPMTDMEPLTKPIGLEST